jgi:hypothetical protein
MRSAHMDGRHRHLDYQLTCVEPGSPMGELLRRYWQLICTSDELRDLPKKVNLLSNSPIPRRAALTGGHRQKPG